MKYALRTALLLAATCLATPAALAADLSPITKAPAAAPIPYATWTGFYIGIEGGYGWSKQSFDTNLDGANIFGNAGPFVSNPFAFGGAGDQNQNGWLAGGFFGAQKQLGNWVVGIEADIDATGMKNSFNSSVSAVETVNKISFVPDFVTTQPFVTPTLTLPLVGGSVTTQPFSFTTPNQTFNVGGQTVTIPGQTISLVGAATVNGTPIPAGSTINTGAVVTITVPGVGAPNPPINITFVAPTNLTVAANGTISVPVNGVQTPDVTVTTGSKTIVVNGASVTIPGQTLTVNNGTVTVPGITIPGQKNPVLDATGAPVLSAVVTPTNTNVTRSVAIDTKIDELASVRGRLGYTVSDNFLLYGTGGLALAHATANTTLTQVIDGQAIQSSSSSASGTMLGWAAGVGLDYRFYSNFILGIEYLHYDFPKHTFAFNDGSTTSWSLGNDHMHVDAVKGRLSYLFN